MHRSIPALIGVALLSGALLPSAVLAGKPAAYLVSATSYSSLTTGPTVDSGIASCGTVITVSYQTGTAKAIRLSWSADNWPIQSRSVAIPGKQSGLASQGFTTVGWTGYVGSATVWTVRASLLNGKGVEIAGGNVGTLTVPADGASCITDINLPAS